MTETKESSRRGIVLKILFVLYIIIVIKLLVFKYPMGQLKEIIDTWERGVIWEGLEKANFTPFETIRMYINYAYKLNSFENLVGNVAVFFPFGFILPRLVGWADKWFVTMAAAFLFSMGIELFQLFSAFGAFDVDDLILNVFGALIGYWIHLMVRCSYENV